MYHPDRTAHAFDETCGQHTEGDAILEYNLERDLQRTLSLLEKNRELALRWVQKKHERHRMERSAKKVVSVWAHHVDTRHWAEVDPVSGKRTPSRTERRRQAAAEAVAKNEEESSR